MADTLETLEIQVKHNASGASREINKTAKAVQKLGNALSGTLPNMTRLSAVLGSIGGIGTGGGRGGGSGGGSRRGSNAFSKLGKQFSQMSRGIKELAKQATRSKLPLEGFAKALGRIAMYRMLRSIIKAITQAFKEGLENAYAFSQGISSEGHRFSAALDSMSSAGLKMKNQLGSAFISLLAMIAPIVNSIIALITKLASAIAQLFGAFTGGTYLKAKDVSKQFADNMAAGGAAAKEWKNQLMGFDEINRLDDQPDSGGGGGGGGLDVDSMFEDVPIEGDFFNALKEAFEKGEWVELGKIIGNKFNDVVNSIDFAGVGKRIGQSLGHAITTAYSALSTADFQNLGRKIGTFLNNLGDGIDFNELGKLRVRIKTALWDVIYGAIAETNWTKLGKHVGEYFSGALTEFADWLSSLDPQEIATAITDFFDGLSAHKEEISAALKAALKAAFDLALGVVNELFPDGIVPALASALVKLVKDAVTALKSDDFQVAHNILMYKLDVAVFGKKFADYVWSQGDYAGKEIIVGMINGLDNNSSQLKTIMDHDVSMPVSDAMYGCQMETITFRDAWAAFTGLFRDNAQKTSKNSKLMGDNVTGDLTGMETELDNVSSTWLAMAGDAYTAMSGTDSDVTSFGGSIIATLETIRSTAQSVWAAINEVMGFDASTPTDLTGNGGGGTFLQGYKPTPAKSSSGGGGRRAAGGFVDEGEMFLAREAGPEMVGRIGSRTAVANNDQITGAISSAVYNAIAPMFAQGNGNNNRPIVLNINGREFARATYADQKAVAREHGASLIVNG